MTRGRWVYAAAAAYLLVLLGLVFSPISDLLSRLTIRLYVLWVYDLDLPGDPLPQDFGFALNVLLFVPIGALLVALTRRPWWLVGVACVLASATIEAVQAIPAVGRQSSLADVVSNGLGGFVGAVLATWWLSRAPVRARSPRRAVPEQDEEPR